MGSCALAEAATPLRRLPAAFLAGPPGRRRDADHLRWECKRRCRGRSLVDQTAAAWRRRTRLAAGSTVCSGRRLVAAALPGFRRWAFDQVRACQRRVAFLRLPCLPFQHQVWCLRQAVRAGFPWVAHQVRVRAAWLGHRVGWSQRRVLLVPPDVCPAWLVCVGAQQPQCEPAEPDPRLVQARRPPDAALVWAAVLPVAAGKPIRRAAAKNSIKPCRKYS